MIDNKFIATAINFSYHLILLRSLRRGMTSTSTNGTCGLVSDLVIMQIPRLLIWRCRHLQDVHVLILGGSVTWIGYTSC